MWGNQGGGYDQGGGGADRGGGFMNTGGGFGSPQVGGSGSQFGAEKKKRAQNVLSCTVAQVHNCKQTDDAFMLEGIELHMVTLVGLVRTVNETSTRLDYTIDDMTGPPLDVKMFVDNDETTPEVDRTLPQRENTYVRVYGHVRAFQSKKSVVSFEMRPILDMNELTTHLLEVTHCYLKLKKALGEGLAMGSTPMQTSNVDTSARVGYAGAHADVGGLNDLQTQVSDMIKGCSTDEGVSVPQILAKFRGAPPQKIKDAIEFLSGEGHIYSTIDDDHYKHTDSM